jgi:hypothetical protein
MHDMYITMSLMNFSVEVQINTERHRETQRDTERYREIQRDTERYREIQRDTERYRERVEHLGVSQEERYIK